MKTFLAGLLACMSASSFTNAQAQSVMLSSDENRVFELINKLRTQLKLQPLQIHYSLQTATKDYTEVLVSYDTLSHTVNNTTPHNRILASGYAEYQNPRQIWTGENLAAGLADGEKTFQLWLFSPGHLSNMINPNFRHIGISRVAAPTGSRYAYYWATSFGSFVSYSESVPQITNRQLVVQACQAAFGYAECPNLRLEEETPDTDSLGPNPLNKPEAPEFLIQCKIPYALGKGVVSFYQNTDAVLEITGNVEKGFSSTLSYFQNGAPANLSSIQYNGIALSKNRSLPLYVIFSPQTNRTTSYSIQLNTQTSQAQFDSYGLSTNISATINCTLRQ